MSVETRENSIIQVETSLLRSHGLENGNGTCRFSKATPTCRSMLVSPFLIFLILSQFNATRKERQKERTIPNEAPTSQRHGKSKSDIRFMFASNPKNKKNDDQSPSSFITKATVARILHCPKAEANCSCWISRRRLW